MTGSACGLDGKSDSPARGRCYRHALRARHALATVDDCLSPLGVASYRGVQASLAHGGELFALDCVLSTTSITTAPTFVIPKATRYVWLVTKCRDKVVRR